MNKNKEVNPKTNWPYDNPDGTVNIERLEMDMYHVHRFIPLMEDKTSGPVLLRFLAGDDEEKQKVYQDAASEMQDIENRQDEAVSFVINHITSGKTAFNVYDCSNAKSYNFGGEYDSEKDAKAAIKNPDEDYTEFNEDEQKWFLWVYNEEETIQLKENSKEYHAGGEYIQSFDSEEDALAEAEQFEYAYVEEELTEEKFVVVDTKTNKNAFNMIFPSKMKALAFLYQAARPEAWQKYVEYKYGLAKQEVK